MQRMLFGWLIVGGIALFSGCGESGPDAPDTASVSGTVTLDGDPVVGAEVSFIGKEFVGYGKTDDDGKYTLAQGAVVGENLVTISKIEGEAGMEMDPDEGMDEGQFEAAAGGDLDAVDVGPKQLIPVEFSDVEKSKLTFNVPTGGTSSADFTLTGSK